VGRTDRDAVAGIPPVWVSYDYGPNSVAGKLKSMTQTNGTA
jgi:hypothetical protein